MSTTVCIDWERRQNPSRLPMSNHLSDCPTLGCTGYHTLHAILNIHGGVICPTRSWWRALCEALKADKIVHAASAPACFPPCQPLFWDAVYGPLIVNHPSQSALGNCPILGLTCSLAHRARRRLRESLLCVSHNVATSRTYEYEYPCTRTPFKDNCERIQTL